MPEPFRTRSAPPALALSGMLTPMQSAPKACAPKLTSPAKAADAAKRRRHVIIISSCRDDCVGLSSRPVAALKHRGGDGHRRSAEFSRQLQMALGLSCVTVSGPEARC